MAPHCLYTSDAQYAGVVSIDAVLDILNQLEVVAKAFSKLGLSPVCDIPLNILVHLFIQ